MDGLNLRTFETVTVIILRSKEPPRAGIEPTFQRSKRRVLPLDDLGLWKRLDLHQRGLWLLLYRQADSTALPRFQMTGELITGTVYGACKYFKIDMGRLTA